MITRIMKAAMAAAVVLVAAGSSATSVPAPGRPETLAQQSQNQQCLLGCTDKYTACRQSCTEGPRDRLDQCNHLCEAANTICIEQCNRPAG